MAKSVSGRATEEKKRSEGRVELDVEINRTVASKSQREIDRTTEIAEGEKKKCGNDSGQRRAEQTINLGLAQVGERSQDWPCPNFSLPPAWQKTKPFT